MTGVGCGQRTASVDSKAPGEVFHTSVARPAAILRSRLSNKVTVNATGSAIITWSDDDNIWADFADHHPVTGGHGESEFRRPACRRITPHLDAYLAADGVDLSTDVLDRIDQIVPPGVTINVADNMWNVGTTSLGAAFRRR